MVRWKKSWEHGTTNTRGVAHRWHKGRFKGCLAQIQHKTKIPLFRFPANCSKQRNATLAQLVERLIRNQQVAGSIPAGGSRFFKHFQQISKIRPVQNLFSELSARLRNAGDGTRGG
jgi:hypothetical protein